MSRLRPLALLPLLAAAIMLTLAGGPNVASAAVSQDDPVVGTWQLFGYLVDIGPDGTATFRIPCGDGEPRVMVDITASGGGAYTAGWRVGWCSGTAATWVPATLTVSGDTLTATYFNPYYNRMSSDTLYRVGQEPVGQLDGCNAQACWGWARDQDAGVPIQVHLYANGAFYVAKAADEPSEPAIGGSGAHRFTILHDFEGSTDVTVYALGVNAQGVPDERNVALPGSTTAPAMASLEVDAGLLNPGAPVAGPAGTVNVNRRLPDGTLCPPGTLPRVQVVNRAYDLVVARASVAFTGGAASTWFIETQIGDSPAGSAVMAVKAVAYGAVAGGLTLINGIMYLEPDYEVRYACA